MTWLDRQPRAQVDAAITEFTSNPELVERYSLRAGNDRRYGLWLAMVDLHLGTLPDPHCELQWDWYMSYRTGWGPRAAAFAAWASAGPEMTTPSIVAPGSGTATVTR